MNQNPQNFNKWRQPNSAKMDPSMAWIRNVGVGTSKGSKNRYNIPAQNWNAHKNIVNHSNAPESASEPERLNTQEAPTARDIVDETANALEHVQISNDIPKRSHKIVNMEEKLITTRSKQEDTVQNVIISSAKSKKERDIATESSELNLQPVYMDDVTLNELMRCGFIRFTKGMFMYQKPSS